MKKLSMLFYLVLFAVITTACGGNNDGGSSTQNTTTTVVSNNLQNISNNFTPSSLDYSSSINKPNTFMYQKSNGDPCEGLDLFACQPVLLRLYLDMGQMFLDSAREIVSEIGTNIGDVPDGGSGTASEGDETIDYSKTSSTDFSILMKKSGSPAGYVDVNGNQYTILLDLANMPDDSGNSDMQTGKVEIDVTYTDDATWSITVFIAGMACQANDPRAPERVSIQISRANGLWTGKAMLYNGRWFSGISDTSTPSCEIAESDAISMNMYTDFVGNNTASKVSVYMMSRTKSNLSDITDFGMDNLSTNFGIPFDTSNYGNPFCNSASDLTALWDNDCSSIDTTVGAASYGASSDWIVPSIFYQQTITIPTAL